MKKSQGSKCERINYFINYNGNHQNKAKYNDLIIIMSLCCLCLSFLQFLFKLFNQFTASLQVVNALPSRLRNRVSFPFHKIALGHDPFHLVYLIFFGFLFTLGRYLGLLCGSCFSLGCRSNGTTSLLSCINFQRRQCFLLTISGLHFCEKSFWGLHRPLGSWLFGARWGWWGSRWFILKLDSLGRCRRSAMAARFGHLFSFLFFSFKALFVAVMLVTNGPFLRW